MVNKSAQELGRLGGQATKKKYGKAHYQKLAENMNKKRWGKDSHNNIEATKREEV